MLHVVLFPLKKCEYDVLIAGRELKAKVHTYLHVQGKLPVFCGKPLEHICNSLFRPQKGNFL